MNEDKVYNTAAWKSVRMLTLQRDGYLCQLKGPGCTDKATEADHIVAFRDGGALYEMSNLQASCKSCNSSKARQNKYENGWKRSNTEIVLYVMGAEVPEELGLGEMVMDQKLHASLGDAGWQALIKSLKRGEIEARIVHIVSDHPDAMRLYPYHRIVQVKDGSISLVNWMKNDTKDRKGGFNESFESSRW